MVTTTTKTVGRDGWFKTQFITRQPKPYKSPLPYHTYGVVVINRIRPMSTVGEFSCNAIGMIVGDQADNSDAARLVAAKAYDKVTGKMKGDVSAMLAVNVAERKESFDLIARRATQILSGARQLRRGDLVGMLKTFGFRFKPRRGGESAWVRVGKKRTYTLSQSRVSRDEFYLRRKVKTASALWLEYWFGWAPLISDVHAAVDILQDVNLDLQHVFFGTGSTSGQTVKDNPWYYWGKQWMDRRTWSSTYSCKYRVVGRVSSPNALKANQLGLTNPATVAWELIPFSFLVDWFVPVSKFLDSYTDTVGFTIKEVTQTTKRTAVYTEFTTSPWDSTDVQQTAFQHRRSVLGSLPIPGLMDRSGNGIASLTRAATAVSLLSGFFKTSKWS